MSGENMIIGVVAAILVAIAGYVFYEEGTVAHYPYSWSFLPISWVFAVAAVYLGSK